jgi:CBS domain containing-hemolysin-like protein
VKLGLELLAVLLIILLNGFFVAAEYALVTVRRTRMRELAERGSRRARAVLRIVASPPRFIAAMQLGVTATSLAVGVVGEKALSQLLDPIMATVAAVVIAFLVITYLHVVIGELIPKGAALGHAERTALTVSTPVRLFFVVFSPLIWVLQRSTELGLRALRLEPPGGEGEPHSEAELKMLLDRSSEHGEIERDEREMLYKVFEFADKEAAEVMVPRPEVVALSVDMPTEQCLAALVDSPFTRFPVYSGSLDDIVGILHVRDLFSAVYDRGVSQVAIIELVRPAHIVPETKDIAALLTEFRRTNQHMAIVVDEYGTVAGIVTLEDVLEEIVGEIEDEFDLPDEAIERLDEGRIRIEGTFPIDDFNEEFALDLPVEDYHTMGGFVFGLLGHAPQEGDEASYDGLQFEVVEVEGSRIDRLLVTFTPADDEEAGSEKPEAAAGS